MRKIYFSGRDRVNTKAKKKLFKLTVVIFTFLLCVATVIVLYALSPTHPKNITDETVAEKGAEYTVKLKGISEYDDGGFRIATDGFYYTGEKAFVYKDEEGFARTTYDGKGEFYLLGEYNSDYISYDKYIFCGESYKTQEELETFFELPDRIYNFDIDKLSYYVQDIINYEKKFVGKATVKIYRGRCTVTGIYIGDEKVLKLK